MSVAVVAAATAVVAISKAKGQAHGVVAAVAVLAVRVIRAIEVRKGFPHLLIMERIPHLLQWTLIVGTSMTPIYCSTSTM